MKQDAENKEQDVGSMHDTAPISIQPSQDDEETRIAKYWKQYADNPMLQRALNPEKRTGEEKPAESPEEKAIIQSGVSQLMIAVWQESRKRSIMYSIKEGEEPAAVSISPFTIDSLCSHEGILYEASNGRISKFDSKSVLPGIPLEWK